LTLSNGIIKIRHVFIHDHNNGNDQRQQSSSSSSSFQSASADTTSKYQKKRKWKHISKLSIVMDLMDANLTNCVYNNIKGIDFSTAFDKFENRKRIGHMILQGLSAMHDSKFVHRDIHPDNILVKFRSDNRHTMQDDSSSSSRDHIEYVCIGDLGQSRLVDPLAQKHGMLSVDVTRFNYSAPELLLIRDKQVTTTPSEAYGSEIDIWSFGCTYAEMILKRQLFAGESKRSILIQIRKLLNIKCVLQTDNDGIIWNEEQSVFQAHPKNGLPCSMNDEGVLPPRNENENTISQVYSNADEKDMTNVPLYILLRDAGATMSELDLLFRHCFQLHHRTQSATDLLQHPVFSELST